MREKKDQTNKANLWLARRIFLFHCFDTFTFTISNFEHIGTIKRQLNVCITKRQVKTVGHTGFTLMRNTLHAKSRNFPGKWIWRIRFLKYWLHLIQLSVLITFLAPTYCYTHQSSYNTCNYGHRFIDVFYDSRTRASLLGVSWKKPTMSARCVAFGGRNSTNSKSRS